MTDDEALDEMVAAVQRKWDAMSQQEKDEAAAKWEAGRKRIDERLVRLGLRVTGA